MFGLSKRPNIRCCQLAGAAGLSLALWTQALPSARAEATITGTPDAVRIESTSATVEELLSGLREKFGLSFRSAKSLDEKIAGTYAGSLTDVVRRLLANYDYVLARKSEGEKDTLEVAVLDKSNAAGRSAVLGQPSKSAPRSSAGMAAQQAVGQTPQNTPNTQGAAPGSNNQNSIVPGAPAQPSNPHPTVAGILQTQMNLFVPGAKSQSTAPASTSSQSAAGYPSQAAIAATLQRANANLQSLVQALNRVGR